MLGGIFHKRKKIQELRSPSLQDIKKFRDAYAKHADHRHVETPSCFEKSIYKAISCQKELHSVDFRQEDITDPQVIALAEALVEMPMISTLDLRDNRITDDGAKAILEVMRLQIIAAKTPVKTDPKTKKPIYPVVPEYTKYVTSVNLKGNEISAHIFQEITQYTDILKREDKRLEIRAALSHIYLDGAGGIDEEEFKAVLKLLTGTEPSKKEVRILMQQHTLSNDRAPSAISLENVLLARCSSSPSKKAACPPWEALVQVRYATLGMRNPAIMSPTLQQGDSANVSTVSRAYAIRSAQPIPNTPVVSAKTRTSSDGPDIQSSSRTSSMQRSAIATIQQGSPTKPPESPPHVKPLAPSQQHVNEFRPPSSPPPPAPITMKPSPVASEHQPSSASTPRAFNGAAISNDAAGDTSRVLSKSISVTSPAPIPSSPPYSAAVESPKVEFSAPIHPAKAEPPIRVVPSSGLSASALAGKDTEGKQEVGLSSRKSSHHSTPSSSSELPPWKDDNVFTDSEEDSSNGDSHDDSNDSAAGDASTKVDNCNGSVKSGSRPPSICFSDIRPTAHRRMDSGTFASEVVELSDGEADDTTSPSKMTEGYSNVHSQYDSKEEVDLSSLVYRGSIAESNFMANNHRPSSGSDQSAASKSKIRGVLDNEGPEDDEGIDIQERVEHVLADVLKDGKQRSISKLIHSEFRRGMPLTDFPDEIPFRNLVVLLLSENALTDLSLMKECRFPCTLALDLSSNKLSKLSDNDLAPFPKLQILNLAQNQIKSIQGLGKVFDLKALNLNRNAIKSVKNIEHLLNLEILAMNGNAIASIPALRLLSMNKVLSHLDLDGNPIVDTDERQRRKNVTNLLNLLPTLRSLGSIPCVSLQSKEKKMSQPTTFKPGKRLLDVEQLPNFQDLWVSYACDVLKVYQDAEIQRPSSRNNDSYDDEWGTENDDAADRPRKALTREEQRQRDELRSRAIAFRSRGKAIPSPPKKKTSAYSFGPPLPPPTPKKKAPTVDRSVVLNQQRRSSELSAPKYPPVDTALLQQEKKRKSRPAFDINMSVAERLQLTKDKAQRSNSMAGCKTIGPRKSTVPGTHQAKRASATHNNEPPQAMTTHSTAETQPSPRPATPMKILIGKESGDVVEFRIEPLRTSPTRAAEAKSPVKLQESTPVRAKETSPTQLKPETPATSVSPTIPEAKPAAVIENNFLHSLAVADFLNHAEEEFSTAVTALTVLLSMSEKANGDPNKLLGYRRSLTALDILDERESHTLFNKVKGYGNAARAAECNSAFERLGVVKKCMKQLLERLDVDSPGSSQIRSFCKSLRTTELRDIVPSESEGGDASESVDESAPESTNATTTQSSTESSDVADGFPSSDSIEEPVAESYSFSNDQEFSLPEEDRTSDTPQEKNADIDHHEEANAIDNEFDFLSTNEPDLGGDTLITELESAPSAAEVEPEIDHFSESPSHVESTPDVDHDVAVFAASTDITQDIHNADDTSVFDTEDSPFDDYENAANALESESKPAEEAHDDLFSEEGVFDSHEFDEMVASEGELDAEETSSVANEQDHADLEVEIEAEVFETQPDPSAYVEETSVENKFETNEAEYDQEDNTLTEAQETVESEHEYEVETEETSHEEYEHEAQETSPVEHEHEAQETVDVEYENEEAEAEEAQEEAVEGEDEDDEEAEMFGDWEKGFDPSSNHYFWFNHATGESSWVPPDGWPYEVDTPFDAEEAGEEYAQEDTVNGEEPSNEDEASWMNEDGDQEGSAVGRQDGTTNSECDDDLFSDHDLPEF